MADNDTYSEAETIARREATLKAMLAMPHKPQKPLGQRSDRKREPRQRTE